MRLEQSEATGGEGALFVARSDKRRVVKALLAAVAVFSNTQLLYMYSQDMVQGVFDDDDEDEEDGDLEMGAFGDGRMVDKKDTVKTKLDFDGDFDEGFDED